MHCKTALLLGSLLLVPFTSGAEDTRRGVIAKDPARGAAVAQPSAKAARRVSEPELKKILRTAPPVPKPSGSLTARKPDIQGIHCMGGQYMPCWCDGADDCNNLIAACVETGHEVNCTDHDSEGKPTGCACY